MPMVSEFIVSAANFSFSTFLPPRLKKPGLPPVIGIVLATAPSMTTCM